MSKKSPGGTVPTFKELMQPVLEALYSLGGEARTSALNEKVISSLNLTEDCDGQIYKIDKSGQTIIQTNLSWARNYLKQAGLLANPDRAKWALNVSWRPGQRIDAEEIAKKVRNMTKKSPVNACADSHESQLPDEEEESWREKLRNILFQLEPAAFERLSMRLLQVLGFAQVEVTGRSNDGGIDGKGIARLQDILSFHVVFQCKRYRDVVRSPAIRDFRGAMQGRAEKGLFITTSSFSNEAVKEATRDGALAIDLIDGDALADMLKRLKLGIEIEMVERVTINEEWFRKL